MKKLPRCAVCGGQLTTKDMLYTFQDLPGHPTIGWHVQRVIPPEMYRFSSLTWCHDDRSRKAIHDAIDRRKSVFNRAESVVDDRPTFDIFIKYAVRTERILSKIIASIAKREASRVSAGFDWWKGPPPGQKLCLNKEKDRELRCKRVVKKGNYCWQHS